MQIRAKKVDKPMDKCPFFCPFFRIKFVLNLFIQMKNYYEWNLERSICSGDLDRQQR